jgi:hypothetical protein
LALRQAVAALAAGRINPATDVPNKPQSRPLYASLMQRPWKHFRTTPCDLDSSNSDMGFSRLINRRLRHSAHW